MRKYMLGMVIMTILFSCGEEDERQDKSYNVQQSLLIDLVNEVRTKGCKCGSKTMPPVGVLQWNSKLANAALKHSKAMEDKNFFAHKGKDGTKPSERVDAAGYAWRACGENIAKGQRNEQEVMEGWLKSVGHCKNIMNPDFEELGVARSGEYWVQVFATSK
ncbi:MAG: CAP domain-containing protein [Aureispira sp.]|nr:CAP domain-containing protein [Aureispira sp.]